MFAKYQAFWCSVALCGAASAAGAQETRTFPEAECSYTLPGKDWQWLDPSTVQKPGGETIVFVHNPNGLRFTIRFHGLKQGQRTDATAFESFEWGLLQTTRMKKSGSKHISFKGVPSYQIDLTSPEGHGASFRILYANEKSYQ